jgi:ribosomal subunit interface protein
MKIRLTARNVALPERLRIHVRVRLALALGRFGERIEKVSVRFTDSDPDADGGHGPSQKHCRIEVGLHPRPVTVEDADADPFAAADGATDRLSRSVARALDREQDEGQRTSPTSRGAKP